MFFIWWYGKKLQSAHAPTRRQAVERICRLRTADRQRVVELLSHALSDRDEQVRAEALSGLLEINATRELLSALKGADQRLVMQAIAGFAKRGLIEPLLQMFRTYDPTLHDCVARAIVNLRAVDLFLALYHEARRDAGSSVYTDPTESFIRVRAVGGLLSTVSPKVKLTMLLEDPVMGVAAPQVVWRSRNDDSRWPSFVAESRLSAAYALGSLGDRKAVEPLIEVLTTSEGELQIAVAAALGKLGDSRAASALIDSFQKTDHWRVRIAIAEALACLDSHLAVKPLESLLNDSRYEVVSAGCRALLALGQRESVLAALRKENSTTQAMIAEGLDSFLSKLGTEKRYEDLRSFLDLLRPESACEEELWIHCMAVAGDLRAVAPLWARYDREPEIVAKTLESIGAAGRLGPAHSLSTEELRRIIDLPAILSYSVYQRSDEHLGGSVAYQVDITQLRELAQRQLDQDSQKPKGS